jgi:rubredoxin
VSKHRYTLEPYKGKRTRYRCPSCNDSRKTFARYIDNETKLQIAENVGMCDRLNNCGYHYTPKHYFQDNNISIDTPKEPQYKRISSVPSKPLSFIDPDIFKASLKGYDTNYFVQFLQSLFSTADVVSLIERYYLGTAKQWQGANVFWQIDITGKIRTGKIMLYNPQTGRRVKECINWVHTATKQPEFELKQCLFGEHLLKDKTKPVAIVESEKTAIIASMYLPEFIWLACGSLTGLNGNKCKVLMGRKIILYPDLKGLQRWQDKARELSHITKFSVSDLLERNATEAERQQGLDLADYLIKFDYKGELQPKNMSKPDIEGLTKLNIQNELKEQFKAEFLQGTELPLEKQRDVCRDYLRRGLSPFDGKAVLMELITLHGFEIA